MVVDDSPLIRKMMRRTISLSKLDVGEVVECTNGEEALKALQTHWVDIVFADLHMPIMSGVELIERMAKDPVLAKVPVVVVSAERGEQAIAHLKELGICAHITKPFTPEQVLEVAQRLLEQKDGETAHA